MTEFGTITQVGEQDISNRVSHVPIPKLGRGPSVQKVGTPPPTYAQTF